MKANQQSLALAPGLSARLARGRGLVRSAPSAAKQIWLAVSFPDMALAVFQMPENLPFAVIEQGKGQAKAQAIIASANTLALALGVMLGMPLNAAYALCQHLKVSLRQPQLELNTLQRYARQASEFTPNLVLSGSDVLLLEVSASLKLFGGLRQLTQRLSALFSAQHTIACTPVCEASELLARNGLNVCLKQASLRAGLGALPLSGTALAVSLVAQLNKCGLTCLQDVWRLPRADLARRFGPSLVELMDLLLGKIVKPRAYYAPPAYFEQAIDLPAETSDCAILLSAAERLLDQAERFLHKRSIATHTLSFKLIYAHYRSEKPGAYDLKVRSQQAHYQKAAFLPQLNAQLQAAVLERPVVGLVLKIDQLLRYEPHNQDLFDQRQQSQQDWQALLSLFAARLGQDAVYRLRSEADHRPEKAWRRVALNQPFSAATQKKAPQLSPHHRRPLWLLSKPVSWKGELKQLKRLSNHERIEAGWWQGQDARRDYCIVAAPSGARCWLYQDIAEQDAAGQAASEPATSEQGTSEQGTSEQGRDQLHPQRRPPQRSIWYVHGLFA